jgi:paraquat-inducible protein A
MSGPAETGNWISCRSCDALHLCVELEHGEQASCSRCGSELYRHIDDSLTRVMAFSLTALLLFILSHLFTFLTLDMGGRQTASHLVSAAFELGLQGYWELSLLVFLTSVMFPLLVISGLLYVSLNAGLKLGLPAQNQVLRYVSKLLPWSLVGVFMLGVLVAIVKLMDLASVIPGPSLYFFAALLVVMVAASANLDERQVWGVPSLLLSDEQLQQHQQSPVLISCESCQLLVPADSGHQHCPRCGEALHQRKRDSISRTWALLITAAMLYVPANVYPIMTVTQLGRGEPDTIFSGVVKLIEHGFWGLALLVFFASIVVPMLKLLALGFLLISIQTGSCWRRRDRTRLFRINEVIGAWSMLDIFLIGILVSLVRMDMFASITAGPGASYFAAVVVTTLFAAHSFDSRLIWDHCQKRANQKKANERTYT